MENLKTFFSNLGQQLKTLWGQLSLTKRILLGVVVGLVIAAVVGVMASNHKAPMEYLFVDVSPEDSQAIVSFFKKQGYTQYEVDDKGVKVAPDDLLRLRLKLTQEGLPTHGQVGWEKFDQQDFSRTEFEQQIDRLRAIQGELGRTIMAIDGITSARVHIVTPKQSLFVEDQRDPTAAVYIRTRPGLTLDQRQIKGIQLLVARSVEGLKTDNITIIDGEGNMLTQPEPKDFTSRMTKEMLDYKHSVEKELEQKIRGIVGRIVGPDRVEAKVDVGVDFTQEDQTISDVDPDRVAVVSRNTTGMNLSGQGLGPTGIPGAKSNVPGEQEPVAPGTSSTTSKRESELLNYEIAKTLSHKTLPVGTIKHISAAVLVDGKQAYPVDGAKPPFEARTPEEMKKIETLVKTAIGFKDGRDEVNVENMMFQLDPFQVQEITEKKKESHQYISTLAISGAVAFALVLFFAFVVRPYFRWLSYDPERKKNEQIIEEFRPDLELGGVQNVQVKEDVPFDRLSPQEQVLYLAKHEPKRTTEAIRMLLNPHQGAH